MRPDQALSQRTSKTVVLMMRRFAPLGLLAVLSGTAFGQSPETLPTFTLADVHPSRQAVTILTANMRGGTLRANGQVMEEP